MKKSKRYSLSRSADLALARVKILSELDGQILSIKLERIA
jgi:hypothetical protein